MASSTGIAWGQSPSQPVTAAVGWAVGQEQVTIETDVDNKRGDHGSGTWNSGPGRKTGTPRVYFSLSLSACRQR
jgi:hypothetical protein